MTAFYSLKNSNLFKSYCNVNLETLISCKFEDKWDKYTLDPVYKPGNIFPKSKYFFFADSTEDLRYSFRSFNVKDWNDDCFGLVWFADASLSWKCLIYTSWLRCTISSSEVPMPLERGAMATELKSSGALVEEPLKSVLPLPGTGWRQRDHCDLSII